MPSRRRCFLSALGVTLSGGLAGCFAREPEGEASLQVLSNLDDQTLEVEITGSDDEPAFADTITVSEGEEVTREGVVAGRDGDSFSVDVTKGDERVSTGWELSCVKDEDMRDLLALIVTGRGEIHVSEACRSL